MNNHAENELVKACKAALIYCQSDKIYAETKVLRETLGKALAKAEGRS